MHYTARDFKHTVSYETADQIWEALSPVRKPVDSEMLYRGQADCGWSLVPSSLREIGNYNRWDDLWSIEAGSLQHFIKYCDSAGIALPGGSILPHYDPRNPLSIFEDSRALKDASTWPNVNLLTLMAMAQHHGVATRLLDWTRNPYVAAYFAASSALNEYKTENWLETQLAIWVLNKTEENAFKLVEIHHEASHWSPHISAQSGVFSINRVEGRQGEKISFQSLDEKVNELKHSPTFLKKLTLPVTEAPRLLKLCDSINLNAATIYASADGAGKAVKDQNNYSAASTFINEKSA